MTIIAYSGPERRKFARVEIGCVTDYRILKQEEFNRTQSKDISEGGIKFVASKAFPVGKTLEVKLWLPSASTFILFQGKVVWSTPVPGSYEWFDTGILIERIDSKDQTELANFIKDCPRYPND